MRRVHRSVTVPASLALAVVAGTLTGCAQQPIELPTAVPTESGSPSATPGPAVEPSDDSTPVEVACADLVDADTIYRFNPNFVLLGDWTPDAGSAAADALAAGGIACRWVNQTSGDTIDVSVAAPGDDELADLESAASAEGEPVSAYGEEAYFEVADDAGTATVFDRGYWLVAVSPAFLEPGEPEEIVSAALAALP